MFKYKMIKSEKFHNMNATVETVKFDDGMIVKRLVSYESVVCDVCLETDTIYLYPRFQYSPTTIRQLTRFLNEYVPLEDARWDIATLRKQYDKIIGHPCPPTGKYTVLFSLYVLGTNRGW